MTVDPRSLVVVQELDPPTVETVIDLLHCSTEFDHLVYRESEIDTLWSLADMQVRDGRQGAPGLRQILWSAHDLVGEGRPDAAAVELQQLLMRLRNQR